MKCIGDKKIFAIEYEFWQEEHYTELFMYVNNNNLLAFERDGELLTFCWNFDELVIWLRNFINNMSDDPYPVENDGKYAVHKDRIAREFDCDDDDEFDEYYDKLYEWNNRHCWHSASAGAILSDICFQQVGEYVEISWDNYNLEPNVKFLNILGGASIPKNIFLEVLNIFIRDYTNHWFAIE